MRKHSKQVILTKLNTFPDGTLFTLTFDETRPSKVVCTANNGKRAVIAASNAKKYFGSPFKAAPSMKTLEKWSNDGIAKTITGKTCEPDGHGDDSSPSWLLAMGMM